MNFYKFHSEKLGVPFKVKYLIDSGFSLLAAYQSKRIQKYQLIYSDKIRESF